MLEFVAVSAMLDGMREWNRLLEGCRESLAYSSGRLCDVKLCPGRCGMSTD